MPPRLPLRRLSAWGEDAALHSIIFRPNRTVAAFSTSSSLNAMPAKKKGNQQGAPQIRKGNKTLVLKKKTREREGNPPAPGERKAFRTRIILSNTNANEVASLIDVDPENMLSSETVGKVYGIPGTVVDQLRAIGAFKRTQGWHNFRRPAYLVREETLELSRWMEEIEKANKQPKTVRKLITGARRTGKSVLLLQAMTMAFLKGWVVVHIPEAHDLTNSNTEYSPVGSGTAETLQFTQNEYTAALLKRIADANRDVLSKLKLSKDYNLPLRNIDKMNLHQIIEQGSRDKEIAWPIFQAFWKEMTTPNDQNQKRPPILFCADHISHFFNPTAYQILDAQEKLKSVHPFDLLLVKQYVDLLTGSKTLPNGGVILGGTSQSNFVTSPPLEVAIEMAEDRHQNPGASQDVNDFWNALVSIDRRVLDELKDLQLIQLGGISKEDSREIIEYWARSGFVQDFVKDTYVSQKWTLSGNGIIGEMERAVIKMNLSFKA